MELYNGVSFAGIFGLLAFAWLISRFVFKNTQKINWHLLGWALALQFIFALFIFIVPIDVSDISSRRVHQHDLSCVTPSEMFQAGQVGEQI